MNKLDRTNYTVIHDRGSFYQGNTIPGLSIRLEDDTIFDEIRQIIHPAQVEAYIILGNTKLYQSVSIREDGFVIIEPIDSSITIDLTPGVYDFKVVFKLQNGSTKTYVSGSFKILRS